MGGGSQEATRRWVRERERAAWAKRMEGRSRGSVEEAMSIYFPSREVCCGRLEKSSHSSTIRIIVKCRVVPAKQSIRVSKVDLKGPSVGGLSQ